MTAVVLGVLGTLAGLAVLATSGWLVTRAAEQPPVLALLVGIVTVRALGLVRALARYGERLAAHDVALRRLADTRVAFFNKLSRRIGRPGLPGATDLLTRFTSDVDELQHLYPRVLLPTIVAVAASVGVTVAAALILPAAAPVLAAGLLVATLIVPAATYALARHAAPGRPVRPTARSSWRCSRSGRSSPWRAKARGGGSSSRTPAAGSPVSTAGRPARPRSAPPRPRLQPV